jgi:hypothetical protein
MPNVFPLLSVAAVALAGVVDAGFVSRCDHPQRLHLKSAYSPKPFLDGARQIHLNVTIDDKGNGRGVLTFDPNIHDKTGSTQIALREVPIKVRLLDEQDGKGRRLYELTSLEAKKGGERWVLVRPLRGGTPSWLVFTEMGGEFRDAVPVE